MIATKHPFCNLTIYSSLYLSLSLSIYIYIYIYIYIKAYTKTYDLLACGSGDFYCHEFDPHWVFYFFCQTYILALVNILVTCCVVAFKETLCQFLRYCTEFNPERVLLWQQISISQNVINA